MTLEPKVVPSMFAIRKLVQRRLRVRIGPTDRVTPALSRGRSAPGADVTLDDATIAAVSPGSVGTDTATPIVFTSLRKPEPTYNLLSPADMGPHTSVQLRAVVFA